MVYVHMENEKGACDMCEQTYPFFLNLVCDVTQHYVLLVCFTFGSCRLLYETCKNIDTCTCYVKEKKEAVGHLKKKKKTQAKKDENKDENEI